MGVDTEISGVFLLSLAAACRNLRVLAGGDWEALLADTQPGVWYPVARFDVALEAIVRRLKDPSPVLERVGEEMMRIWYEQGPGRAVVKRGIDFLYYQAGSEGYLSLVRGDPARVGRFVLEEVREGEGLATVRSTTPFDRSLERGVLRGGMEVTGDLDFVSVTNAVDPSRFDVRFR